MFSAKSLPVVMQAHTIATPIFHVLNKMAAQTIPKREKPMLKRE
jgi:hypothetical protein